VAGVKLRVDQASAYGSEPRRPGNLQCRPRRHQTTPVDGVRRSSRYVGERHSRALRCRVTPLVSITARPVASRSASCDLAYGRPVLACGECRGYLANPAPAAADPRRCSRRSPKLRGDRPARSRCPGFSREVDRVQGARPTGSLLSVLLRDAAGRIRIEELSFGDIVRRTHNFLVLTLYPRVAAPRQQREPARSASASSRSEECERRLWRLEVVARAATSMRTGPLPKYALTRSTRGSSLPRLSIASNTFNSTRSTPADRGDSARVTTASRDGGGADRDRGARPIQRAQPAGADPAAGVSLRQQLRRPRGWSPSTRAWGRRSVVVEFIRRTQTPEPWLGPQIDDPTSRCSPLGVEEHSSASPSLVADMSRFLLRMTFSAGADEVERQAWRVAARRAARPR